MKDTSNGLKFGIFLMMISNLKLADFKNLIKVSMRSVGVDGKLTVLGILCYASLILVMKTSLTDLGKLVTTNVHPVHPGT